MSETWRCTGCAEDIPDSYAECWNCREARPGYSTPAEQVKQYDEQNAEVVRQLKVTDEIQAEHVRLNRADAELLQLEKRNQDRLAALLDRWEKLTDVIESLRRK